MSAYDDQPAGVGRGGVSEAGGGSSAGVQVDALPLSEVADEQVLLWGGARHERYNPALIRLRIAWRNEKCAPELLPFEEEVFQEVATTMTEQQKLLDEVAADSARAMSSIAASIYQLDLERVRYLLAAYTRERIRKIERSYLAIVADEETLIPRLNKFERNYLRQYLELRGRHLTTTVLGHLSSHYSQPPVEELATSMAPRLSTHVFAHTLRPVDALPSQREAGEGGGLVPGRDVLVRFSDVREAVTSGAVLLA